MYQPEKLKARRKELKMTQKEIADRLGISYQAYSAWERGVKKPSRKKVKQMIERQKIIYGWEFLFLGANIDAVETASLFGIDEDRAVNYQCDSEGTALNYEVISEAISAVRCSVPLGSNWKKRIDEDFKKRGNRE